MLHILIITAVALGLMTGGAGKAPAGPAGDLPSFQIEAGGGAVKCPAIYAPVICDNGKTYPNQCEADRHHAKNCVPTGDL